MIQFSGNISEKCKKYICKKAMMLWLYFAMVTAIIIGIPSILVLLFWDIAFFVVFTALVIACGIVLIFLTKNDQLPRIIEIEDGEIYAEMSNGAATRNYDDIKKIVDYGEFYDIIFYFPNKVLNCICQKDLIQEGTIEDFEELFKDYIVRKYKS